MLRYVFALSSENQANIVSYTYTQEENSIFQYNGQMNWFFKYK